MPGRGSLGSLGRHPLWRRHRASLIIDISSDPSERGMHIRSLALFVVAALVIAVEARPAHAQDIEICYATADRVANGEKVTPEAKTAGHEACQRALAATSSIMQKQDIQEADFDIVGRPSKQSN
jgi:hypothetical protein